MTEMTLLAADALVLVALAMMTIAMTGLLRLPDLYNRIHAAGQAALLGLAPLLLAIVFTSQGVSVAKTIVLGVFLLITVPISAHAIARAAFRRNERVRNATRSD